MKKRGAKIKHSDPLLRTQPWRVASVFQPIESVLSRLEIDGTIDTTASGDPIFIDHASSEWYDTTEALRGIIEFHQIASDRRGEVSPVNALRWFAEFLVAGQSLTADDIAMVRADIAACKRQAYAMRSSEVDSVLKVVSIGVQLELNDQQREAA